MAANPENNNDDGDRGETESAERQREEEKGERSCRYRSDTTRIDVVCVPPAVDDRRGGGGGRTSTAAVAIKSLVDVHPSAEDLSTLYNEYNVLSSPPLRALAESGVVREALGKEPTPDGRRAIRLRWVDGAMTLREWSSSSRSRRRRRRRCRSVEENDLTDAVRTMAAVASAVGDLHDAGYVHNDLSADNVLIRPCPCRDGSFSSSSSSSSSDDDDDGDGGGEDDDDDDDDRRGGCRCGCLPRATLIDFGHAARLSSIETDDAGCVANDDLYGLGVAFAETLLAPGPSAGTDDGDGNGNGPGDDGNDGGGAFGASASSSALSSSSGIFGMSAPTYELRPDVPRRLVRLVSNLAVQVRRAQGGATKGEDDRAFCDGEEMDDDDDDEDRYRSAGDVAADLRQMIADPVRFLYDDDDDRRLGGGRGGGGRLDFPPPRSKLHGRDDDVEALREAHHDRVVHALAEAAKAREGGENDGGRGRSRRGSRRGSGLLLPPCGPAGLVFVSGPAGAGKTALVDRAFDPCDDDGDGNDGDGGGGDDGGRRRTYRLVRGKFRRGGGAPHSALASALDDLCDQILARCEDAGGADRGGGNDGGGAVAAAADGGAASDLDEMAFRIRESAGGEARVLLDLVPKLRRIVDRGNDGDDDDDDGLIGAEEAALPARVTGAESLHRLTFLVRSFLRIVSTPERPVILHLDDGEFADESSLELVRALVSDRDNLSLLIVLCYREEEVDMEGCKRGVSDGGCHPLAVMRRSIVEGAGNDASAVRSVRVGNLTGEAVADLVSDATRTYRRLVESLASLVRRKTHGNAFYVRSFLRTLVDEDLLTYDERRRTWKWEEGTIRSRNVVGSAVGLLSDRILAAPKETREVLKVAACVGTDFDASTLRSVLDGRDDVDGILDEAVVEGFVDPKVGSSSRYKFSHNRVKEAAYALIPENERSALHLRIGLILHRRATPSSLEKDLFLIVDQQNLGMSCIAEGDDDDEDEKLARTVALAALNLRAGERSMSSSAFSCAVSYFKIGAGLLDDERRWEDEYDLTLSLHSSLVEALYCAGHDSEELDGFAEKVFDHALTFLDAFRAHLAKIKSLGSRGKLQEGIDLSLLALDRLGVSFPKPKTSAIVRDLLKTKLCLRKKTEEDILNLPEMEDETKVAAMEVLNSMMFCAMLGKMDYVPFIVFRLVRLTLKYGVCRISAYGFSLYGMMLCGHVGDLRGGYRFGRLALRLVERLKASEWHARVSAFVYIFINHWFEPIRHSIDPLLYAHRTGLQTGDVEYAMMTAQTYCNYSFQCGRPLAALEGQMRAHCLKMVEFKQETCLMAGLPLWQTLLNLLGRCDDPMTLTGEAMDQERMLEQARNEGNANQECTVYISCMKLAYIFNNFEAAGELAEKSRKILKLKFTYELCSYSFFAGLVAVAMARKSKKRTWRIVAKKSLKTVKKWEKVVENCQNKVLLLKAELAALNGKDEKAKSSYKAAITTAREHGYVQDEALSYERAGAYYLEAGDEANAARNFARAHLCYVAWGAKAKADQFLSRFDSLMARAKREDSFRSFARSRFMTQPPS